MSAAATALALSKRHTACVNACAICHARTSSIRLPVTRGEHCKRCSRSRQRFAEQFDLRAQNLQGAGAGAIAVAAAWQG
jgi:hypothetical protein